MKNRKGKRGRVLKSTCRLDGEGVNVPSLPTDIVGCTEMDYIDPRDGLFSAEGYKEKLWN